MRLRVRGMIVLSMSAAVSLAAFTACVSPSEDFPAPTQPDTTKKPPPKDSSKTPPDTGKKTPPPPAKPTATAALGTPAQVIKGWGMYPAGGAALYGRDAISQAIYASGITFVRVSFAPELYASGTTVSTIALDQTQLSKLVQALGNAQHYGVTSYIASVWSPPASMKTNHSVNGGSLLTSAEAAYVAYLTKVVLTLHASGLPLPSAISIQNEPEFSAGYSSAVYSVAQWQRVITAARASFDANGLSSVVLFGPETGTFGFAIWSDPYNKVTGYLGGGGYPSLSSSTLNHAIGAYAFHAYGECEIVRNAAGMQAYPKDAWQTEFSAPQGSTELDWTIDTYRALAAHLVVLPFNYWAWWNGFATSSGPPDGGTLIGGNTTPIYSKRYWALKQLWTTVRPGWTVTPMTTTDPNLQVGMGSQDPCEVRVDLLAFTSPDRSSVAVLMTNTSTTNKLIAVSGLPGTSAQPYITDASNDMAPQTAAPITSGTANIPLPPNSAVLAVTH
jgi:glucuronoarabinoxylan endo-1,4-beta-xylanase